MTAPDNSGLNKNHAAENWKKHIYENPFSNPQLTGAYCAEKSQDISSF